MNNYIGIAPKDENTILVWERSSHDKPRKVVQHDASRYFFIPNENGEFTSMYKDKLEKLTFESQAELEIARKKYPITLESDFYPEDRILMDKYHGLPTPPLNYAFWDIETLVTKQTHNFEILVRIRKDNQEEELKLGAFRAKEKLLQDQYEIFDPEKSSWTNFENSFYSRFKYGFVKPKDATAPVNAITLYKQWKDQYVTLAVPPEGTSLDDFDIDLSVYGYEKINLTLKLFATEAELLDCFLKEIEDIDLLSGWNSEYYDLPYIFNRTLQVLGETAANRFNYPGTRKTKLAEKKFNGREEVQVILNGRQHIDYLDVFKKFTFGGRESFALNSIAETELGTKKLDYEGNLGDLYRNEFQKFVAYNIIDVVLLKQLDEKFRFINLVNQMAHENTVKFAAILGTTKYIDIGITNFAINKLNLRVKDCPKSTYGKVEGAIVLTPNTGLHEWVASVDINSLYPSVIRSLNLSPEKIIGQFDTSETQNEVENDPELKPLLKIAKDKKTDVESFIMASARERDWLGIYNKDDKIHTANLEDGDIISMTGAEWNQFLEEMKWAVSAFGTILDQSGEVGIVAQVLGYWYSERKRLQKELKVWKKKLGILEKEGIVLDEEILRSLNEET